MSDTRAWLERDATVLASVLPRCTDIVAEYGEGSWLVDVEGRRYLDFASGIAACSTGHCHPMVVEAIRAQAGMLIHTSVTTHNKLNVLLAERIAEMVPYIEDPQVFFCNSGAEAVDGSLKLARKTTGRPGVLAFYGGFHGRTVAATALTHTKRIYRDGYHHLPFVYHRGFGESLMDSIDFLQYSKIGAIIVEPILGEGGYVLPPDGWLSHVREIATEIGALLIFDEVQTGAGRTGCWFAAETFGVTPDVILFAKGIASGMPIGGLIAARTLMDKWPEGAHGSTFGGNPVSCAAGMATIDILEPLLERVRYRGQHVIGRLSPFGARGRGYMIGIPMGSKERAHRVQEALLDKGLLVLLCGANEDVLRLIPPLTASDADWAMALDCLESTLATVK